MRTVAKAFLFIAVASIALGGFEVAWATIIEPNFTKPAKPGEPGKLSLRVTKPGDTFEFSVEPDPGFGTIINDTEFDITDFHLTIIKIKGSTDADWGDFDGDKKIGTPAGGIFSKSKVEGKTLTLFDGKIPKKDGVFSPAFKAKLAEEGDFIEIRGSFSSAVPEPSTIVLLGSALLGLVVLARRRSRVAALDAEDRP